jgi:hypothetical protein
MTLIKSNPREYASWSAMMDRCTNDKNPAYKRYGGRGITVCDRWRTSFENFLRDMGKRPDRLSLERKNNDLGYSPDNCKWATPADQARNKRNNLLLTFEGRTQPLITWCDELGLKFAGARSRLKRGKSAAEVLQTVIKPRNQAGYKGIYRSGQKYAAHIRKDGEYLYLGTFPTPIEAAQKYNEKALELHGDRAVLNEF